jgi:integrase
MGRIFKQRGSPFWSIDYVDANGERQRVSTKQSNKKKAADLLVLRESEALRGELVSPRANKTTFEMLRDNLLAHYHTTGRWKNLKDANIRMSYLSRTSVGEFQSGFGGLRVASITPSVIRAYATFRLSEKVQNHHKCAPKDCTMCRLTSKATVNRELAFLRKMLNLGHSEGLVLRVPKIEMLQEAPARGGFVDDAQFKALCASLRADLRVVVSIGYRLGWRVRSEVLTLTWSQVSLDDGTVRLNPGKTKNKDGRLVHLPSDLRAMLVRQLARVGELEKELEHSVPWVFPHLTGPCKGQRVESFVKAWKKATARAGLPGLLVHDLRRSAVRNMERLSVPRSVAMRITGHQTESVYRRYAIVSDADMREAAFRLGASPTKGSAAEQVVGERVPMEIPEEVWRIIGDENPGEHATGINTAYSVVGATEAALEVAD